MIENIFEDKYLNKTEITKEEYKKIKSNYKKEIRDCENDGYAIIENLPLGKRFYILEDYCNSCAGGGFDSYLKIAFKYKEKYYTVSGDFSG